MTNTAKNASPAYPLRCRHARPEPTGSARDTGQHLRVHVFPQPPKQRRRALVPAGQEAGLKEAGPIGLLPVAAGQAHSASPLLRIMPRTDARPQPRVPDRTQTADLRVAIRPGSPLVVEIRGEIDIQSAPELRDELLRV